MDRGALRRPSRRWWRPTPGPSGPGTTSARRPSCSSPTTRSSRPPSRRASTSRSPGTRRWPGASSPPPGWPGCRSSSGATRSPRPRTSCTSSAGARSSASAPSRPRTRSPASAPPSGPPSAARSGVTTTSGPGLDLKSETIGLAINLELPLIIVDVQRGGPSTGLPTKTEQADLLHALYGRHGEAPLPILAPQTPSDCFAVAIEATRLAVKYRTPVIVLSDGYLANGAEPWRLPDLDALRADRPGLRLGAEPRRRRRQPGLLALRPRPRDAGAALGPAGPARPRAPHRRPREGGRQRQRLLRGRQPRAHGPPAPRQDRRHRRRHPAGRGERRDGRRAAAPRQLGLDLRRRGGRGEAGAGPRHEGGPRPPAPPEPAAGQPGRGAAAATPRSWCPRSTSAS